MTYSPIGDEIIEILPTMLKTFDTVDMKVAEAEFFLQKMAAVNQDVFEVQCYFSAFLAAIRTITLALQQFADLPGFEAYYAPHRDALKNSGLAQFFLNTRNDHLHGGSHPIRGGSFASGKATYHFADYDQYVGRDIGKDDVVARSRDFFVMLLRIVYDCYVVLGPHVDPQQYYTREHFASLGKTVEQAECEIYGWICSTRIGEGYTIDDRWHHLRADAGCCLINHLFHAYLGKTTPTPIEPEHYRDFAFTDQEKGWVHIPAGFSSAEEWIDHLKRGN